MATKLSIDDALIDAAVKLGRHKTQKAAVTMALKEYIQHKEQVGIINLFNQIDYDESYDYKQLRQRN